MTCCDLRTIYAYLEGDLGPAKRREFEAHLAACLRCRAAAEERRAFLQAAASLPPVEVPDGFAAAVMSRLEPAPARATVLGWVVAAFAGLASFAVTLTAAALLSGHSLSELFLGLSRFLWKNMQGLSLVLVKAAKYASLAVKILAQLAGGILDGLRALTSLVGPDVRIASACAAALLIVSAGFWWRRKIIWERTHDE